MHAIVNDSGVVLETGNRADLQWRLGELRWLVRVPDDTTPDIGDRLHVTWDNQRAEMRVD